jgi:hypothetical protein
MTANSKSTESATASTIKAWRVHTFGAPEAMIFETVPEPDPGPGEVLVKVHAAGSAPGTRGLEPAGVRCRSLFRSRWALTWLVRSKPWVQVLRPLLLETRFSALPTLSPRARSSSGWKKRSMSRRLVDCRPREQC